MKFKIRKTILEVKFDYLTMFKLDKALASKDENGQPQNDGIGNLFSRLVAEDDTAIVSMLVALSDKLTENRAAEAIADYISEKIEGGMDEEAAYNSVFTDLKAEMVESGFSKAKISKYIDNLEKAAEYMEGQAVEAKEKFQVEQLAETIGKMKSELS